MACFSLWSIECTSRNNASAPFILSLAACRGPSLVLSLSSHRWNLDVSSQISDQAKTLQVSSEARSCSLICFQWFSGKSQSSICWEQMNAGLTVTEIWHWISHFIFFLWHHFRTKARGNWTLMTVGIKHASRAFKHQKKMLTWGIFQVSRILS